MEETYTKLLLYTKLPDHICRNILQIIYCRKTKELNFSLNPLPLCVRQLSGEVSLHLDLNCTNFLKYCFRAGYIYIYSSGYATKRNWQLLLQSNKSDLSMSHKSSFSKVKMEAILISETLGLKFYWT